MKITQIYYKFAFLLNDTYSSLTFMKKTKLAHLIVSSTFFLSMLACNSNNNENKEPSKPDSLEISKSISKFVFCRIDYSSPRIYNHNGFSNWENAVYLTEIIESKIFNEEMEYRMMDDTERDCDQHVKRFLRTTPMKVLKREVLKFNSYKEASLKLTEIKRSIQ